MTVFCNTCKIFREFRIDKFFESKKERVVCGVCNTILTTKEEIEDELEYEYMRDYFEV